MKTSFKRFAALALAAIMVLGTMNLSAWADTVGQRTADAKLTVSGLAEGDVVRFYKILKEDSEAVEGRGWAYTSKYVSMSSTLPVSTLVGNPAAEPPIPASLTAATAGDLVKLSKTAGDTPVKEIVVDSSKKAEWEGADPGLYLVFITPADPNTVYNPVFVSTDYVPTNSSDVWNIDESASYTDEAAAKKSTLTITKSADTTEDGWDDKDEYTTAINDSVSFHINTTVPGYGKVYDDPKFVITDTLKNMKLIQTSSMTVKDENGIPLSKDTDYTTTAQDDGTTFTVTLLKAWLEKQVSPIGIRIDYKAQVTVDPKDTVNVEDNEVKVEFSQNPSDETETGIRKDSTQHYTFSIDANSLYNWGEAAGKSGSEVVKVGIGADGKPITSEKIHSQITDSKTYSGPLQGAEFKLYTDSECKNEYIPKSADGTRGTEGLTIISDANGRMNIPGLDGGDYYLKETKAPDGFIKDPAIHHIKIDPTINENVTIVEWFYNGTFYKTKAKAIEAATGNNIPTSHLDAYVKECRYTTDVLESVTITIDGKDTATHTFTHTSESTGIKWSSDGRVTHETPFSIKNTQGVELPSTGGVGTTIFYMGGAVLVLLAGVLLVSKRRLV